MNIYEHEINEAHVVNVIEIKACDGRSTLSLFFHTVLGY